MLGDGYGQVIWAYASASRAVLVCVLERLNSSSPPIIHIAGYEGEIIHHPVK